MTPVDQTLFYDPDAPVEKQRGNCLQAVLASLLDLPLDEVPHFVQDHVDHDGDHDAEWEWWHRMLVWLGEQGWKLHDAKPIADYPGQHLAVIGRSPRRNGTIHHVVIWRDGEMVHDPHPDRTGLLDQTDAWGLYRVGEPDVRA